MDEVDGLDTARAAGFFIDCNRNDTAPVGGDIPRQQGLRVILEIHPDKAVDRRAEEISDLAATTWIFSSVTGVAGSYLVEKPEDIWDCSP